MNKKILVIVGSTKHGRSYPPDSLVIEAITKNKTSNDNDQKFLDSLVRTKKFDAIIIDDGLEDWIKFNDMNKIIPYILQNIIKTNGIILLNKDKTNIPIKDIIRKIYSAQLHMDAINNTFYYIKNSSNKTNSVLVNNANNLTDWYNLNKSPFDLDILNINDTVHNGGTAETNIIGDKKYYKYTSHCLLISISAFLNNNGINNTVSDLRKISGATHENWPYNQDFDSESKYGADQIKIINNIAQAYNLRINIHGKTILERFQTNQQVYGVEDINYTFPEYFKINYDEWVKNEPFITKYFVDILQKPGHYELLNWKTPQEFQYTNSLIKNKYLKYKQKYMTIKSLI